MAKKRRTDREAARAEACALLGLDPVARLSPADALRVDTVAALRAVIDHAQADAVSGTSTDLARLLVAVEKLTLMLPVRAERPDRLHGDCGAREAVMRLITSAIHAERTELFERRRRGEPLSEAERLRLRLHEIEDEAEVEADAQHQDDAGLRAGDGDALAAARREVERLERENKHLRGVAPFALPKPLDKALKPAKPEEPLIGGSTAPPPSAAPPPSSARVPSWDSTRSGRRWHEWRNNGGEAAADWWANLPGRTRPF